MSAPTKHWAQDKEATVYVGNLDERVTDEIIWELMLNAGRIANVHLPKDRVSQSHQGYGFVEFATETDAEYAVKIMNQIRLWGKPIRVKKASADKNQSDGIGAELFIGNLDSKVDEMVLQMTFSRFGTLASMPKIQRDDMNLHKGFGFVSYTSFEASDEAIHSMHGQILMNKEISVQYAYKKDGKGARHGDDAERAIAASGKLHNVEAPIAAMPVPVYGVPATPTAPVNGVPAPYGFNGMPQQPMPPPYGAPPGFGPPPGFAQQYAPPPGFGGPPMGGTPNAFGMQPHMQMGQPPGMPPPGFPGYPNYAAR